MCAKKTHKKRNNNKNNYPSDIGTRNLQVNFGGSIKKRLNATEQLVLSPTPYGYSLFITKKRESFNCRSTPTGNKTVCHFEPCVRNLTIQWHFEISRIRSICQELCNEKDKRTEDDVGAHRCVRPKYTQAMRNRADTPVCPYGKKTNIHKKEKNL